MLPVHYRLSIAVVASLVLALAGCGSTPEAAAPAPTAGKVAANAPADEDIDTTGNIMTFLGITKKESERQPGPLTGPTVSPILWQAAKDTLDFVRLRAADPMTGSMSTEWYSPPDKPNERFKIDVFVMSRALHSDSVAVTVERQVHGPGGQWIKAPVERDLADQLETTILHHARRLRQQWSAQKS
jgi:Domain of unknown function (DUF3576)